MIVAFVAERSSNYRPGICQDLGRFLGRVGARVDFHSLGTGQDVDTCVRDAMGAGCSSFLAIGGDGTVNLVATSLVGRKHRLGIIPTGTANTMARMLGIPLAKREAIRVAGTSENTRAVDGMEIGGKMFMLNVSVGLSSASLNGLDLTYKKVGMFSYVIGLARNVRDVQPVDLKLSIDDRQLQTAAVEAHVTNTGVIGSPRYIICERSRIDDGRLEVIAVDQWSLKEKVDTVLDVLTPREKKAIHLLGSGRTIVIDSAQPLPVQADGDIIGKTPVRIDIRPQAINFIIP